MVESRPQQRETSWMTFARQHVIQEINVSSLSNLSPYFTLQHPVEDLTDFSEGQVRNLIFRTSAYNPLHQPLSVALSHD